MIAAERGLQLPLVYSTGGYDSLEALELLEDVVDIYMPDMKYGDSEIAQRYSHVRGYVEANRVAVQEMHRQVGDLVIGADGIARRGLLIRHLVLPADLANTERVLEFLVHQVSAATHVNVMGQYHPCYRAYDLPPLDRTITQDEYRAALEMADRHGVNLVDTPGQEAFC